MVRLQTVDKASQSFFARRQKISSIIFAGGVYVGENISHSESVDMCASGAHEAQV